MRRFDRAACVFSSSILPLFVRTFTHPPVSAPLGAVVVRTTTRPSLLELSSTTSKTWPFWYSPIFSASLSFPARTVHFVNTLYLTTALLGAVGVRASDVNFFSRAGGVAGGDASSSSCLSSSLFTLVPDFGFATSSGANCRALSYVYCLRSASLDKP